ncbi:MAG: aminoacetone oxidase family FAD-binding enzyme [Lachnospiraceae bacterium]|nr:aminoacetone oxidase family FAD-binding enzyme [Lachnospiraceae bacterium]
MKKIVIIGGGASGLMAGIMAARAGAAVTILEKCEKPGKKILATGNGRCNLTNRNQEISCYHGDKERIRRVLSGFTPEETLSFFHGLGLFTKERDGWVYPRTDQALSVVNLLLQEYASLKGKLKTLEEVTEIRKEDQGFTVYTKGWHYQADAVIVACGTPASNIEGVSGDALKLARDFGITCREFRPSLVPLKCRRENYFAKWAGVRTQAVLELVCEGRTVQTETGELQLTDYGISGIPVFQLSSRAGELLEQGKKPSVKISFLPDFQRTELENSLKNLKSNYPDRKPEQLLAGLLPDKLLAALSGKKTTLEQLLDRAFCTELTVTACGALKQAQICAGGISLDQLTEHMEAKNQPGLFFTGECTDTDGRCGGYNLQWAWSTGAVAGIRAARERRLEQG